MHFEFNPNPKTSSRGEDCQSHIKETIHPLNNRCGTLHTPLMPMDGYPEREQFNIGAQHRKTRIEMGLALIPCKMDLGPNSSSWG
uniref:Putative ovule protein n=1 Tax=Solanum chacoense TaxID=4108 RepID=A0A0V0GTZ3_SOLCH